MEPGKDRLAGEGSKGSGFPRVKDSFLVVISNILLNPDKVGVLLVIDDIPETCSAGKWLLCYNAGKDEPDTCKKRQTSQDSHSGPGDSHSHFYQRLSLYLRARPGAGQRAEELWLSGGLPD